jgi:hypothetical protein
MSVLISRLDVTGISRVVSGAWRGEQLVVVAPPSTRRGEPLLSPVGWSRSTIPRSERSTSTSPSSSIRHVVTFWEALSDDGDQYATVGEVAEVLARLHALTAPDSLRLLDLAPFETPLTASR